MSGWWDVGGKWGQDDEPFDWEARQRDDDLGWYGFVFLLAIATLVVTFLAVV